jgi:hypothetical protein
MITGEEYGGYVFSYNGGAGKTETKTSSGANQDNKQYYIYQPASGGHWQ